MVVVDPQQPQRRVKLAAKRYKRVGEVRITSGLVRCAGGRGCVAGWQTRVSTAKTVRQGTQGVCIWCAFGEAGDPSRVRIVATTNPMESDQRVLGGQACWPTESGHHAPVHSWNEVGGEEGQAQVCVCV